VSINTALGLQDHLVARSPDSFVEMGERKNERERACVFLPACLPPSLGRSCKIKNSSSSSSSSSSSVPPSIPPASQPACLPATLSLTLSVSLSHTGKALASDLGALVSLRSSLRQRFVASPFGDGNTKAHRHNVDEAFRKMWTDYCLGDVTAPGTWASPEQ